MIFKNAKVLNENFKFCNVDIEIQNGVIKKIYESEGYTMQQQHEECLNLKGFMLIPGLIDIHTHGCSKRGCMEGSFEAINEISLFMASHGVTSFLPTSRSEIYETLAKAFKNIGACIEKEVEGAEVLGIHMEGPYFSEKLKGAQSEKFLREPSVEEFNRLQKVSGNNIMLISLAPETSGAMEFIRELSKKKIRISMAHTSADYNTAKDAIENGVSHATHLFNAMTGLNHREPGATGAALDSDITVELICDGIHVHPAVIRLVYKIKGSENMIIVSDTVEAAGLVNDSYMRSGEKITVIDGIARTSTGNLAGSTTMLDSSLKKAVSFGIRLEDAIKMMTINPARFLGIDNRKGSISIGKDADLVVLNSSLEVVKTFVKGKIIEKVSNIIGG